MAQPAYVAVDWGTSSFRLWLMDGNDTVLQERRSDEGMTTAAEKGFAQVLEAHLGAIGAGGDLPVIVCGMAGARQGWVEAGYVDVPAPLTAILDGAVTVPDASRDIRILPGLAQRSLTAPDVMRGEETQLLGALGQNPQRDAFVCMPGTHSKWVRVADGKVTGFSSFMTGELFDVVSKHSILRHAVAQAQEFDEAAFVSAVRAAIASPAMATNLIFTVRPAQLLHGISADAAKSRLSGLMIGLEIAGASSLSTGQDAAHGTVILVASGRLRELYEIALGHATLDFVTIDADEAVRKGLSVAAGHIGFSRNIRTDA